MCANRISNATSISQNSVSPINLVVLFPRVGSTRTSEDFGSVLAGIVSHPVATFGYSYFEKDQPGNVNADAVVPLLQRNKIEIEKSGQTIYDVLKRFKVDCFYVHTLIFRVAKFAFYPTKLFSILPIVNSSRK